MCVCVDVYRAERAGGTKEKKKREKKGKEEATVQCCWGASLVASQGRRGCQVESRMGQDSWARAELYLFILLIFIHV